MTNRSWLVPFNGSTGSGLNTAVAKDYYPSWYRGQQTGHNLLSTQPSASSSMTSLLARTNPSRPDYVPLTLLQDLVDIPRQLRDVGRLIRTPKRKLLNAKEIANQHLGFQFGWLPLIQDVKDLLDLQSHIHKRVGELHRLYDSGGLKRRIRLGRWSAVTSSIKTTESFAFFSQDLESIHTVSERWGTVRWLPSVTLPTHRPSDADIIRQAKQVTLGLSYEATLKGAWDLIPWTWLIDWFTNVGEFAMQYSNTVPAIPTSPCVMTKTDTKYQYRPVITPFGLTGGGGYAYYTTKERYVGSGSLNAHLPFIGAKRLSILGALFVQRFKH